MDSTGRSNSPRKSRPQIHNDNGQVRLTAKMREKEKELRRFLAQQRNRTLKQSEKQRMIADFMKTIDTLIQVYRLSEKLDAAGDTLSRVFKITVDNGKKYRAKAFENFRNWIVNFDVWGSFLPLTA